MSSFKTSLINNQEWMTENLKISKFRNGDPIPYAGSNEEWKNAADNKIPAYCIPKYKGKESKKAGFLYNWYAVNDSRKLAPHGWLIPNQNQVNYLLSCFSDTRIACIELKAKYGWENIDLGYTGKKIDGNGTNRSGFCAEPSPSIEENGEVFFDKGNQSYWIKEGNDEFPDLAYILNIGDRYNQYESGDSAGIDSIRKGSGLPIRCIKCVEERELSDSLNKGGEDG